MRRPFPNLLAASCCVVLAGTASNAQTSDPMALPGSTGFYEPNPMGGVVAPGQGARGVFLGTIAALLAQGVGNALSQGLAGSITQWFSRPAAPAPTTNQRTPPGPMQVGLAYEVHLIGSDGASRPVDAARHVFRTGDRFLVHYRPALPGRIEVDNVNPQGAESHVDGVEVAAGQLATLGPYRFVEAKGIETLKLTLQPCTSPMLAAATRGIVKVGSSTMARDQALRLGACGESTAARSARATARTITKTTVEGSTAFAFDSLGQDELSSGRPAARELRISLQHR